MRNRFAYEVGARVVLCAALALALTACATDEDSLGTAQQAAKPTKAGNGEPCGNNNQCASGNCVDSICCDTLCSGGACDACNVAGSEGTCLILGPGSAGNPSCAPFACDGASAVCPTSCSSDTECAAGLSCAGGSCLSADGQSCASGSECASGNCVDSVCCGSPCAGDCDSCDVGGSVGTCVIAGPGSPGSPACSPYVCDGVDGACPTSCTDDAHCDGNSFCSGGACTAKLADGATCGGANECESGYCVDGVCCDIACTDSCEACDVSGSIGSCSAVLDGDPGAPSCSPYVCDGSDTQCPTSCGSAADCAPGAVCTSNECILQKANGETCTNPAECASSFCVDGYCCESACDQSCDTCAGVFTWGSCTTQITGMPGDPSCDPYVCDGSSITCPVSCTWDFECAATGYCAGGACQPKAANGATCTGAGQCLSGNCADGRCCDSPCSGSCDSCNLSGFEGTCAPSPAGSPGAPTCAPYLCDGGSPACSGSCASDAQCAAGHYCEGAVCTLTKALGFACTYDGMCTSNQCVDGVCCNSACGDSCDACNVTGSEGTCSPVPDATDGTPSCSPFLCDGAGTSCPTACVGDEDCVAFSFCDVDVCAPVSGLADGSPCADPSECLSLQCVEGVCCDTACNLPCDSCALAGTEGACTTVPAGDPGEPTCAPHLCGAAGECGETCTTNADCATPFQCTKGTCGLDFALVRGWSEGQMLDPMNHAAKSRVWVETVSVLRIHLLSPTSNIDVVFYDPLGNEIDYDSAGALGMSYSRWYYGDPALSPSTTFGTRMGDMGYHVLLEVESPPAGLWEIKTTAIIPPAQVLPIRVGVETDGGAAIGAVTDKDDYLLTDSVVVFANLVNVDASPPTAITGATVKATFLQYNEGNDQTPPNVPDNPAYVELTLVDDGSGNDAVMNDGVYTGSTTLPVSSSYMLNVQAEGLDGFGQTFQRGATKNVRVQ